tara:strand:+ start:85 stop:321 length:237 start_codon:yes stop_codon:yes gene_type:complete
MSRNNIILVANVKIKNVIWYYVFVLDCADDDYHEFCINKINEGIHKRTKYRTTALLLAHDKQKDIQTEYGVNEITIKL